MKKIILILFIIMMFTSLFSYSILEREIGNFVDNNDPRASAMGGASTSGGNRFFDIFVNPSNLGFLQKGLGSQFSVGVMKNDDNRSMPMYNFFDGYIDDATYVSNVHYFEEYAAGLYYKYDFSNLGFSAAFSYKPFINFDSSYEEEVRNDDNSDDDNDDTGYNQEYNYPPIIAKNFIKGDGSVNSMSFITACSYKDIASLGVEVASLKGDSKLLRKMIWTDFAQELVDEDLSDSLYLIERNFDALSIKAGANILLDKRFGFGISYTPKIEFEVGVDGSINEANIDTLLFGYELDENDAIIDTLMYSDYFNAEYGHYKIPSKLRLGFSYQPRNIMKTYFNFDLEMVNWSDINSLYDNQFNYYIGVEHKLNYSIPLRIGFRYVTDYQLFNDGNISYANKVSAPTFTVGTGFTFMKRFTFDISAAYSNRKYEALDLFMDGQYNYSDLWNNIVPEDRGWENPDQVSESFMKIQSSISFNW